MVVSAAQVHREAHNQAQAHLAHNLELALHALLVVMGNLDIVVAEAQRAAPQRGNDHEYHVDVAQLAQQQAGHHDGQDDDDASHGGSAFLLHLPLQAQVAHNLAHLHELQAVDNLAAKHDGYKQRQDERKTGTEGDVVKQPRARHVELL